MTVQDTLQAVRAHEDEFIALRRDIHQHPELPFEELRTPMTLIMGMTELALKRAAVADVRPMLQEVQTAAKKLMVLLNDLIDLAALEAHQVPFQQEPLSVPEVAASSVRLIAPLAAQKGLSLELVPAPGLPAQWHLGDAERIQQVLLNLLDNAVKFSHSGAIRLELNAQEAGERTTWSLRVIDQGIGITAARTAARCGFRAQLSAAPLTRTARPRSGHCGCARSPRRRATRR